MELEQHLVFNDETINAANLCDRFTAKDLDTIGAYCKEGYDRDLASRSAWERRTSAASDLALQVTREKTFPWAGASNIAFPLVTIAAMQFHARAYPAILQGNDAVKYRVIGPDPEGKEAARAQRIGTHMSYQVLEEDQPWEEQLDRALLIVPIVGCAFKKSYYSASLGHNASELVHPSDLVIDYYAKSVESCGRKTQRISLFRNEIYERCARGAFCDIREEPWYLSRPGQTATTADAAEDVRAGRAPSVPDDQTPFLFLEQHTVLDLDGDGYYEPYIVTFEAQSGTVVRIVARVHNNTLVDRADDGSIISIRAAEYFTKIPFIPSPDGSIYDIGFGVLLGPLNESVNSLINQLVDAGTMSTSAGGFLGRGAKIRGGVYTFSPLEWKRVDSTGEDLAKSIYPLPVREPSAVLFNLLSLVINFTQRVSGSVDAMVGENPGQNTPASTQQSMVEQGSKIYSAIFKRVWRSLREEFSKLFILNAIFLPVKQHYGSSGAFALREDYLGDPTRIAPVADPNVLSNFERMQQAVALKQAAATTPGYDPIAVEHLYLSALKIENVAAVYPGADKTGPLPNPKMEIEMKKLQIKEMDLKMREKQFVYSLMEERELNRAKIVELETQAALNMASADGVQAGHEIAVLNAQIGAQKNHNDHLTKRIELLLKGLDHESAGSLANGVGMDGMAPAPSDQTSALPSPEAAA